MFILDGLLGGRIGPLTPDGCGTSLRASVSSSDSFDWRGLDFLDHDVVGFLGSDITTPSTILHDEETILDQVFLLLVESKDWRKMNLAKLKVVSDRMRLTYLSVSSYCILWY